MGGFFVCWLVLVGFAVSIPALRFFRCTTFCMLLVASRTWGDAKTDFFEAKIRPVLATHCFECHGNKEKGGLKLDSREAILKGGDSGPVVVPGKPKESLLLKAVRHEDEDLQMPPKKKLPGHVVADLKRWIREGAVWPEGKAIGFATGKITDEQRRHWAYQPLKGNTAADGEGFIDARVRLQLE